MTAVPDGAVSRLAGDREGLSGLAVRTVALAVGAVLLQLKPVRVVTPVLPRDVVAVLALLAGQRDLRPNVGGSHVGVPFYVRDTWTTQTGSPQKAR